MKEKSGLVKKFWMQVLHISQQIQQNEYDELNSEFLSCFSVGGSGKVARNNKTEFNM
jgi:hypothetical protein